MVVITKPVVDRPVKDAIDIATDEREKLARVSSIEASVLLLVDAELFVAIFRSSTSATHRNKTTTKSTVISA